MANRLAGLFEDYLTARSRRATVNRAVTSTVIEEVD
jgi:hypothetical protein